MFDVLHLSFYKVGCKYISFHKTAIKTVGVLVDVIL